MLWGTGLTMALFDRRPKLVLLFDELGGHRLKIGCFEDLANFDLGLAAGKGIGTALEPLDRFFLRVDLEHPEARDHSFWGEGAVGNGPFPAGEFNARSFRARLETLPGEQHAGFRELFIVLP